MCIVLVLAATRGDDEPEWVTLGGRTSKGLPVVLRFVDGELRSLEMTPSVRCPADPEWRSFLWRPRVGAFGQFHQEGARFRVRHRWQYERGKRQGRETMTLVMRGRLADDGDSARGTVDSRWVWRGTFVCQATVRFSARQ